MTIQTVNNAEGKMNRNGRLSRRISAGLLTWLSRDGLAMLLYALVTVLMTYPLAFKLGQNWLGTVDSDTFVKLWDIYWLEHYRSSGQSFFYVDDLFYPIGLDLSYHSLSWAVAGVSFLLTPLLGRIDAYNVTILAAVWTTAYAGYLLIRSLVKRRAAAWLGGAVYSLAPYHIAHAGGHPDLVHLAPVPLTVLWLSWALERSSRWYAAAAAFMVGLAACTSLYILVFTVLTAIPVFFFLAWEQGRWRRAAFWQTAVIFLMTATFFLIPRLYPIFRSLDALSFAIESKYATAVGQTDLLAYLIPSFRHPLFAPHVREIVARFNMNQRWPAYLGLVPVGLSLAALTWKKERHRIILWFFVAVQFFMLSLGTALRFNGQIYDIMMPAQLVTWFPPIRAVARPDFFVLGVLLPLGVGVAYGLERWLGVLEKRGRYKAAVPIILTILLLFEYWNGPFQGISAQVSPFYAWLAGEPDDFALIDLPLGRQQSKLYLYYQTIHRRPIVEGLSARTPNGAYRYINDNDLLRHWRHETALNCEAMSGESLKAAWEQLTADNFRYVLVHQQIDPDLLPIIDDYLTAEPIYRDAELSVYRVADLQANPPC